ncbi:hypothetical protein Ahy_A06g029976 isoform F [Arachis hypogaea]|uniref:Uncharacterized protein n=1 Tax=Arachis hypogaea TaxID=3818 RepID=A0A445CUS0_ARAHY|nr:hypothetical protein Ahy_A06g029976 isoform F [Arachis hypogaea]
MESIFLSILPLTGRDSEIGKAPKILGSLLGMVNHLVDEFSDAQGALMAYRLLEVKNWAIFHSFCFFVPLLIYLFQLKKLKIT